MEIHLSPRGKRCIASVSYLRLTITIICFRVNSSISDYFGSIIANLTKILATSKLARQNNNLEVDYEIDLDYIPVTQVSLQDMNLHPIQE